MKLNMLLTPRLFVLERDISRPGVVEVKGLNKGVYLQRICVVPRGECSFRRMRLVGKGRNAIKAAKLSVANHALYTNAGSLIDPDKGEVLATLTRGHMVGIWSFERHNTHKGRYLPESLVHQPMEAGVRIVRCLSGYDGQIWVDKNLVASRWWVNLPSHNDWDVFMRASQEKLGPMNEPLPSVSTVPYRRNLPILNFTRDQVSHWFSAFNVGAVVTLFLASSFAYIGAQYVRESLSLNRIEAAMVDLSDETELILSQRRRALANLRYVQGFNKLGRNDSVFRGLEALADVFSNSDFSIERFDVRDGQMDVRLRGGNEVSVPQIVSLLEESAGLTNVSVTLGSRGSVLIKADLALAKAG